MAIKFVDVSAAPPAKSEKTQPKAEAPKAKPLTEPAAEGTQETAKAPAKRGRKKKA